MNKRTNLQQKVLQVFEDQLESVFTDDTVDWVEEPISFRQFVESPDHMDFPSLSERQYEVADFMLGGEVKGIFDNLNTMACLLWGKGSGKDSLACLIILYIVYWLLCTRSPQKYFGLPEGEAIDILNVAANAEQASTVFFDKFKQRVLRWKWLKNRGYSVKMSGIYIGQLKADDVLENAIIVTKNGIIFPHNIRAFSGHSAEQTLEGKNLLCWILDEASAFDTDPTSEKAQKLYDVLRSSAVSRFGQRWKGFIISYPRYNNDFTIRMTRIAEGELHWYSDKGATWEIKPANCFRDFPAKFFTFEGHKIPIEYEEEFRLDPTDAKGKYLVEPPEVSQAFIEYPERVDLCVDRDRPPIAILENLIEDGKVKKKFIDCKLVPDREHIVTIDLGLKNDSASLSIFHKETRTDGDYFVQDFVTDWVPDKKQGIVVSLVNIEEILSLFRQRIRISGVFFDQWNSALLTQRLNQASIFSQIYRLTYQDYKNFKDRLYFGKIRLLDYPAQLIEIKRLVLLSGNKVDHPIDGSKDITDTIVGAVKMLVGPVSNDGLVKTSEGEVIVTNLFSQGGTFIG